MTIEIRDFRADDYGAARELWAASSGVRLGPGDSEAEVAGFLRRNPGLSKVAVAREGSPHDEEAADVVVAAAMCGHDGRRGYLYHLAVDARYRSRGIGTQVASACLDALRSQGIQRAMVFIHADNDAAASFWQQVGGQLRADLGVLAIALGAGDHM